MPSVYILGRFRGELRISHLRRKFIPNGVFTKLFPTRLTRKKHNFNSIQTCLKNFSTELSVTIRYVRYVVICARST